MSEESGGPTDDGEAAAADEDAADRERTGPSDGGDRAAVGANDADSAADESAEGELNGDDEEVFDPSLAGVFGARSEDAPPRPEIVPESPSLENVVFLLLGVALGCFVVYRAATVFGA